MSYNCLIINVIDPTCKMLVVLQKKPLDNPFPRSGKCDNSFDVASSRCNSWKKKRKTENNKRGDHYALSSYSNPRKLFVARRSSNKNNRTKKNKRCYNMSKTKRERKQYWKSRLSTFIENGQNDSTCVYITTATKKIYMWDIMEVKMYARW